MLHSERIVERFRHGWVRIDLIAQDLVGRVRADRRLDQVARPVGFLTKEHRAENPVCFCMDDRFQQALRLREHLRFRDRGGDVAALTEDQQGAIFHHGDLAAQVGVHRGELQIVELVEVLLPSIAVRASFSATAFL